MKKILKEFLKDKAIKDKSWIEFMAYGPTKNDKHSGGEYRDFFIAEAQKKEKRAEEYEAGQVRKTIRFSKKEFEIVEAKLKEFQIDFSNFAKNAIIEKELKFPIEKELLFEISRIGNNLNQIAKRVNQNEKIEVLKELVEIEKAIKSLTNVM